MTARIIPVSPVDYVVFGGTGDLAMRKLLPSLLARVESGQLPQDSRIIAVSRQDSDDDAYRAQVRPLLQKRGLEPAALERFLAMLGHVQIDVRGTQGWDQLKALLLQNPRPVTVHYLATSPALFQPVIQALADRGMLRPETRVVLEKPIGTDLASAQRINRAVGSLLTETQIYRIDHYLGKETVQNLMALRFANALFEPLWNGRAIDHIQVTVAESLGVEGRGGYYDHAGALRDMVQNHLLQLVCLVAMEPPTRFAADAVRDEKIKVLRALRPLSGAEVAAKTVRGQYAAGAVGGQAVAGYLQEADVPADSRTETFVALKLEIDNWRWGGTPIYLRTGKRLPRKTSQIVIQFRPISHSMFDPDTGQIEPNRLIVRLQPDEGVSLSLMTKDPGPGGMRLRSVPLDLSFSEAFKTPTPDAYERLLMDVVRGNQTLFMRADELEQAWTWIDPIAQAWAEGVPRLHPYNSGSWGPSAAIALIERDGRTWVDEP